MSRHLRGRRGERGLSLVETMFAMSVLSIAVLGLAASTTTFGSLRRLNEENQTAQIAARQQVDVIRGTTFSTIAGTFNNTTFTVDLDGNGVQDLRPLAANASGMVGSVTVTNAGPVAAPTTLLLVQVTIAWRGISGNRSFTLSTQVANRS